MRLRKKDGAVIQARVSPRIISEKVVRSNNESFRQITAKQLSILLYHFYMTVDDPDVGFLDADTNALKFQAELNQSVLISTENLEKLLYHLEYAYEKGCYWNPAEESFDYFVKGLVTKDEQFDRLMCLILKKKGK